MRRGLVYANDGDWVESLTALVEDHDGTLRLLSHTHATLARLGPRRDATRTNTPEALPTHNPIPALAPAA